MQEDLIDYLLTEPKREIPPLSQDWVNLLNQVFEVTGTVNVIPGGTRC